jgi:hypothetical protein
VTTHSQMIANSPMPNHSKATRGSDFTRAGYTLRDRIEVLDDLASLGLLRPRDGSELHPTATLGIRVAGGERPWRPAPMPERHRWLERLVGVFRP